MGRKILLADDSVTIQKVVELTFAERDTQVISVGRGDEVLARAREAGPDLILLDVILPGGNGYDVCEAIKGDPALRNVPVLLLTGTFEPFDRRRAEAVGADGHLTKPFESEVLVARVTELLRQSRRGRVSREVTPMEVINEGSEYSLGPATSAPAPPRPEPAPAAGPTVLPPEALEEIARRVAQRIGESVVREVAWEVVPDVAERLVRRRIREIEEEAG